LIKVEEGYDPLFERLESFVFITMESSVEEVLDLINEADQYHAFLSQKYEPDFKVSNFFEYMREEKGFRIFSLKNGSQIVSFISVLPPKI
jgi:hypothetical protein